MSEVGLDNLKTVAQAIAVIDAAGVTPRVETIGLLEADGRVLAERVVTDRDYPPFDKALMDGYALHAATWRGGPFRRAGEIAAGQAGDVVLGDGECVAIMTGAPLPPGTDAVVPIERTSIDGAAVTISGPVRPGDAVAPRAIEANAGDAVLDVGTRLGPTQLAVAAQVGAATVKVFSRPRVGILATGDEVVAFDRTPIGSQVRGSNSIMLAALVRRYGCEVYDLGHVPDDRDRIAADLMLPGFDAVLVSGGMSMGQYDFTPRVLADLRYDLAITKVKMKPGKPFVFARGGAGADFVFGLPGNPVSAFVCTVRLVSRLLLRLGGASPEPLWAVAKLDHDLPANGPREFYQPAVVDSGLATVPAWNGSADVFTLARANALLVRGPDEAALPRGSVVTLLRLP